MKFSPGWMLWFAGIVNFGLAIWMFYQGGIPKWISGICHMLTAFGVGWMTLRYYRNERQAQLKERESDANRGG